MPASEHVFLSAGAGISIVCTLCAVILVSPDPRPRDPAAGSVAARSFTPKSAGEDAEAADGPAQRTSNRSASEWVDVIRNAQGSPSAEVRRTAAEGLVALAEQVDDAALLMPLIMSAQRSPYRSIRESSDRALQYVLTGAEPQAALPAVQAALASPYGGIRASGGQALISLSSRLDTKRLAPTLEQALTSAHRKVREAGAAALIVRVRRARPSDTELLRLVAAAQRSSFREVRQAGYNGMIQLASRVPAESLLPIAREALRSSFGPVRAAGTTTLSKLLSRSTGAAQRLGGALGP